VQVAAGDSCTRSTHQYCRCYYHYLARSTVKDKPLCEDDVKKYDYFFKASLYLSLGMIYPCPKPSLREPLKKEHFKARLLSHFGAAPGQIVTYMHFNRRMPEYDLDAILISRPGKPSPTSWPPCMRPARRSGWASTFDDDDNGGSLAPASRVTEILSEHTTCAGCLEGYIS
jgi:phosphoketolase